MGVLSNITKSVGVLSQEAKKTYEAKKLERRIKNYRNEETELYTKLGRMLYRSRGKLLDEAEVAAVFDNLDAINSRMKHLDKQITDIRGKTEDEYLRLSRKESDLTIARTNDGIRLMRLCPECKTVNDPAEEQCVQCRHVFGAGPESKQKQSGAQA